MVAQFNKTLEIGKQSEEIAEQYFRKRQLNYVDVRNEKAFQKQDIDYIVDSLGAVEVKKNYHTAMKYHPGDFFWIEISIDEKPGWWQFCEADYFFFIGDNKSIIIRNDKKFKYLINELIKYGDHSGYGLNRFDNKLDRRWNKFVTAKNMRVYVEQLKNIEYTILVNRRPITK